MKYILNFLRKKQRKVFYSFLISYILVICIPIMIGGGTYALFMHNFKKEVETINAGILKQLQIRLDEQLNSVEKVTQTVSINPYVMRLLNATQPIPTAMNYSIKEIISEISNSKAVNASLIEDYYIYFQKPQIILTASSKFSPEVFHSFGYNYLNLGYDDWKSEILDSENSTFYVQESTEEVKGSIIFAKGVSSGKNAKGRLVMKLNSEYVLSLIGDIEEISSSVVCVADENGKALFTNSPLGNALMQHYNKNSSDIVLEKEKWSATATFSQSLMPNIRYIVFIPEKTLSDRMSFINRSIWLTVILILILGGIFITFFTKKNYQPVYNLIKNLDMLSEGKNGEENEYAYIMESLRGMQEEKQRLLNKVRHSATLVKEWFFIEALKGNTEDSILGSELDVFGLQNELSYLQAAVIQSGSSFSSDDIKLLTEMFCDDVRVNCVIVDETIAAVLTFEDIGYFAHPEKIFEEISNLLFEDGHKDIIIGLGSVQSGIGNINISYKQAQFAVNYCVSQGKTGVLKYTEIDISGDGLYYNYPIEIEQRILNYVKNSEVIKARKILEEIIEENTVERSLEADTLRCFTYDIISTANKIIWETKDKKLRDGNIIQKQLLKVADINEAKQLLKRLFDELEECLSDITTHNEGLKRRLVNYIQNNFNTTSFSLTSTADHFNITSSYLSRYFRENFGETFNTYVMRYKIDRAKEMLINTNYSVKEISLLAGYVDTNNFIRTFKRLEGVTPGQYRANNA